MSGRLIGVGVGPGDPGLLTLNAIAALETAEERGYYQQLAGEYTARRDVMRTAIEGAGLTVLPAQGAFFLMADPGNRVFETDMEMCFWLIREAGVTTVPPSAFYLNRDEAPVLARLAERVDAAVQEAASRPAPPPARRLGAIDRSAYRVKPT